MKQAFRRPRPSAATLFAVALGGLLASCVAMVPAPPAPPVSSSLPERAAAAPGRGDLSGRVTRVRDGDTIEVGGVPVRLAGLDCAERGTGAGQAATARMRALTAATPLQCRLTGRRSYDRWIGTCRLPGGATLSQVMVAEGYCAAWR